MEVHKIIINLRVVAYEQPNVVGERFSADDSKINQEKFPCYCKAHNLNKKVG